jgi:hypothetical protein
MEPKTPREARAERIALGLASLEKQWRGKQVGIGFDADTDTGRIVITFGVADEPAFTVTITADIDGVSIGTGDAN